jgi:3'(2'), 5'-bisphosphate nucleotidase
MELFRRIKTNMFNITSPETKFILKAVREASSLVKMVQAEMVSGELTKYDRSPVTIADFASQALVGWILSETFPDDLMVAEEDSSTLQTAEGKSMLERITGFVARRIEGVDSEQVCAWIDYNRADTGERFWTLDPIDGTKGFLRGDQYVVALALLVDGQVQIGALGCPNIEKASTPRIGGKGSLLLGVKGAGAWSMSLKSESGMSRLHVSDVSDPTRARILRSFESGHTNVNQIDQFAAALAVGVEPVRMDSQAKYSLLAAGEGELYLRLLSPSRLEYREKIWDQAAGSLILEEAGGRITDLDGKQLDFSKGRQLETNRGVLGSNGHLHEAALDALRQVGA